MILDDVEKISLISVIITSKTYTITPKDELNEKLIIENSM